MAGQFIYQPLPFYLVFFPGPVFNQENTIDILIILLCFLKLYSTVEALVSWHPQDVKKVSLTGAGRLREWKKLIEIL